MLTATLHNEQGQIGSSKRVNDVESALVEFGKELKLQDTHLSLEGPKGLDPAYTLDITNGELGPEGGWISGKVAIPIFEEPA